MILVTGASGLLGSNFLVVAQRRGARLAAVSHRHSVRMPGVEAVRADLTDRRAVEDLCRAFRPRWIVHCAALTDVDRCEEHPEEARRVNAEVPGHLAEAARHVGAGLLYISTDGVFDGTAGQYAEGDAPAPVNVYAETKLAGEDAVRGALERHLIVRTNIYGWNLQEKLSLAEWILGRLETAQDVPGFRDAVFTPILVNDLSEVLLDMLDRGLIGVYHVAGSQALSKYEFALALAEEFALSRDLVRPASLAGSTLRASRPPNTSLQTAKVSRALGRPMPDATAGLRRFKALRDAGFVKRLKALGEG